MLPSSTQPRLMQAQKDLPLQASDKLNISEAATSKHNANFVDNFILFDIIA